ncbi:membrane protein of unknown function [Hyphomicrobium sp. MC1]|nr:membrane protein of unknown function [Hyphomicrobium sp. MC1]
MRVSVAVVLWAPILTEATLAALAVALFVPVTAVAPEILPIAAITTIMAIVVEPLVARLAIVVTVLIIEIALLLRERRLHVRLVTLTGDSLLLAPAELVTILIAELVAVGAFRPGKRMRPRGAVPHRVHAALLRHLLAIAQDDAIIMLGVLEIVLSEHRIARRQRIARQADVLLGDMRGRTANLHVGPRTLEAAHQRILRFAVIIIVVVSSATATVLLTLPHGLPFMLVGIAICARQFPGATPWILRSNSKKLSLNVTTVLWIVPHGSDQDGSHQGSQPKLSPPRPRAKSQSSQSSRQQRY